MLRINGPVLGENDFSIHPGFSIQTNVNYVGLETAQVIKVKRIEDWVKYLRWTGASKNNSTQKNVWYPIKRPT